MKSNEFLLEYSRQITAQNYGNKLLARAKKDRSWDNFFYRFPETAYLEPEKQAEKLIQSFEQADPTQNKEYMQWIIRTYINDPKTLVQDIYSTVREYLIKFHKLKQKKMLQPPKSDINTYKNFGDFMNVMDEYSDPFIQQQMVKGEYKTIYQDNNLTAIVPTTQDAACYFGQGSRWCTSATRSKNYFPDYNAQAPLVIILPKQPEYQGEKYQLHFVVLVGDDAINSEDEYLEKFHRYGEDYMIDNTDDRGQFKNEKDIDVSLEKLGKRFGTSFSNVVNALEKAYPETKFAINTNFSSQGIG